MGFAEKIDAKRRHAGRGLLVNARDAIKHALKGTGPDLAVKTLS
jgi:hypothetical protein